LKVGVGVGVSEGITAGGQSPQQGPSLPHLYSLCVVQLAGQELPAFSQNQVEDCGQSGREVGDGCPGARVAVGLGVAVGIGVLVKAGQVQVAVQISLWYPFK